MPDATTKALERQQKLQSIMNMDKPFAFRLAAVNAAGTDKGKTWGRAAA